MAVAHKRAEHLEHALGGLAARHARVDERVVGDHRGRYAERAHLLHDALGALEPTIRTPNAAFDFIEIRSQNTFQQTVVRHGARFDSGDAHVAHEPLRLESQARVPALDQTVYRHRVRVAVRLYAVVSHHLECRVDRLHVPVTRVRLHQRGVRAHGGPARRVRIGSARFERARRGFDVAATAIRGDARAVRRGVGPNTRRRHSALHSANAFYVLFVAFVRDKHVVQTRAHFDAAAAHRARERRRGGFVVRRQKRSRRRRVRRAVRFELGRGHVVAARLQKQNVLLQHAPDVHGGDRVRFVGDRFVGVGAGLGQCLKST